MLEREPIVTLDDLFLTYFFGDSVTNGTSDTAAKTSGLAGHFNWLRQKVNWILGASGLGSKQNALNGTGYVKQSGTTTSYQAVPIPTTDGGTGNSFSDWTALVTNTGARGWMPNNADWDSYITPGLYYWGDSALPSGTNPPPVSYSFGTLLVFNADASNGANAAIVQMAITHYSEIWTRSKWTNASWLPWTRLANADDLNGYVPHTTDNASSTGVTQSSAFNMRGAATLNIIDSADIDMRGSSALNMSGTATFDMRDGSVLDMSMEKIYLQNATNAAKLDIREGSELNMRHSSKLIMAQSGHLEARSSVGGPGDGVYHNLEQLPYPLSSVGFLIMLSQDECSGLVLTGGICDSSAPTMLWCNIRRNTVNDDFETVMPLDENNQPETGWRGPADAAKTGDSLDMLQDEVNTLKNSAIPWLIQRINNLENHVDELMKKLPEITLSNTEVDTLTKFDDSIHFNYVTTYIDSSNTTYSDSLLITVKRTDGACRQLLIPMTGASQGGGGWSNSIRTRSGSISPSLAWSSI